MLKLPLIVVVVVAAKLAESANILPPLCVDDNEDVDDIDRDDDEGVANL